MKKLLFILLLSFTSFLVSGQEKILLDSCYTWARSNYPNLRQQDIRNDITGLQKENLKVNHLPQITLNGQATYQSDVTGIDIPLPNITIPRPSKDQYKAFAEIQQSIWDGGLTAASVQLEEAILMNHLNQLEVEIYRLYDQVSQAFFTVLTAEKQLEVLHAQKMVLEERLKIIESGVRHGTSEKTPALVIRAEILNLIQNELQMESIKNTGIHMLSVLTGRNIDNSSGFHFNGLPLNADISFARPEIKLFESQRQHFEYQMVITEKSLNPKVFSFAQAGYGKPGLNMLNNQFDTYYLIGAGITWNPFDWNKTARQKKVLQLQQELVNTGQETFIQNINLLLARQKEEINKLQKVIQTDEELLSLRSEVTKAAASRLDNEVITTSEYIREVQSETIAKLNYELHKLQLSEAIEKYNLIKGKWDLNPY
jgi:outer membrane protein TolC